MCERGSDEILLVASWFRLTTDRDVRSDVART